jgi:hypothetical protein
MDKQKSLDRILTDVDEPEESLDAQQAEAEAPEEAQAPEAEAEAEPSDDQAESSDAKPDAEQAEGEAENKDGLPPWMHARLKGEQEKAKREREERERIEREYREAQSQLQQMQQLYQQQTGDQQQPTIEDVLNHMQQSQTMQAQQMKVAFSKRLAAQEFGQEVVNEAFAWAQQEADRNPQFNQALWQSAEPAYDVVQAYRRQQTQNELEKYGGDLDALIQARMAQQGHAPQQPAAGATGEPQQAQPQQGRAMPSNFASGPGSSGGQRGKPEYGGPTPLSKLLND